MLLYFVQLHDTFIPQFFPQQLKRYYTVYFIFYILLFILSNSSNDVLLCLLHIEVDVEILDSLGFVAFKWGSLIEFLTDFFKIMLNKRWKRKIMYV